MVVDDCMNVVDFGWLIIAYEDKPYPREIRCGDKIVRGDTTFTIKVTQRGRYDDTWWLKRIGLVLTPNDLVPSRFEIGDEIEILPKEK